MLLNSRNAREVVRISGIAEDIDPEKSDSANEDIMDDIDDTDEIDTDNDVPVEAMLSSEPPLELSVAAAPA